MKTIKMNDIDLEIRYGTAMYIEIDVFRFVKEQGLSWVTVQIEECGEYKFLGEIVGKNAATHDELRKIAIKWLFDNVGIENKEVI